MPEDLQQLLSRINDGYLKQAEAEKEALLTAAKTRADAIAAEAGARAEQLLAAANAEAGAIRKRYQEEIKCAARDCVRELRNELNRLLLAAAGMTAAEAMTPAFMAELIRQMADAAPQGADAEVHILANPRSVEALRTLIPGTIRAQIKAGQFKGGLQISLDDSGEYFDFSDEAVCNFLREHLGSELNQYLGTGL